MANGANRRTLSKEEREELQHWFEREASADPLGLLKLKQSFCSDCRQGCGRANRFCTSCGKRNENFSDREFFFFSDNRGIEELQAQECFLGHPRTRAATRQFPRMPFCSFCGMNCAKQ